MAQIQGLHYSTSRPPQLMPNFPHPLRCCTITRYILPYYLGSTTDPAALQVQEHVADLEDRAEHATSYANKCSKQLASFYAGQPIATFDTLRKIWIPATVVFSFQRTATKYTLQMESIASIPDATSGNAVSDAMTLSPRPHQPHQNRLIPGFPDLCHSLPQPFNKHHNQLLL